MNGLVRKLPFVHDFIQHHRLHVFCITESHLLQSMPDSYVSAPGYSIVRNDIQGVVAKHGVCLYIHESVKYDNVHVPCSNCISVRFPDLDLHLVVAYRPPSYTPEENQTLLNFLVDFCSDREVLVLGDFNLPSISWVTEDPISRVTPLDSSFYEAFLSLGLTQWVSEPTFPRSSNILDLILSTEDDRVASVEVIAPLPGCDHCAIVCDYLFDLVNAPQSPPPRPSRKWHKGRYCQISQRLNVVDWDFEFQYLDCQGAYDRFIQILSPLISEFVPTADTARSYSRPPWRTNPPSSLRNRRKEAWRRFKEARRVTGRRSAPTLEALRCFLVANNELKGFALRSQADYEQCLVQELNSNPKQFHAYLRRKKVGCPAVGPLRIPEGSLTDDPDTMANLFASSFEGVYVRTAPDADPAPHQVTASRMTRVEVSLQKVIDILTSLDANSAAGADDMHPALLKSCALELAVPLHRIFCMSLRECRLPKQWKTSIVVPIFKKGSRYEPLNYRPVSLTSVPGKCLERVIVQQLNEYLENHSILSDHQFGFRTGRSTMDQLLLVYNDISKWLDEGSVVDLILFDFSKAFDVVSHPILLVKLHHLGIDGRLLSWIEHFLTNRTMSVSVKGRLSTSRQVASGVPQGSVLGPILFLIFVNHIASTLRCCYKIFADDLKVYMKIQHDNAPHYTSDTQACQGDITALEHVARSWSLKLNEGKCAVIRFKRRSHVLPLPHYLISQSPIRVVNSHADLGLIVDNELKFHEHIATTTQKAAGLTQNLAKSTVCRSPDFMMSLFNSHVRPIIDYASCVWNTGYVCDLRRLESVQRRWTKRVTGLGTLDYRSRLQALRQYSVTGRLLRSDIIQYWKIFHEKCSVKPNDVFTMAPQSATRGHRFKLSHVRTQTDVRKRAFSIRRVEIWNSLPDYVVAEPDLKRFKGLLADVLGEALYDYPV